MGKKFSAARRFRNSGGEKRANQDDAAGKHGDNHEGSLKPHRVADGAETLSLFGAAGALKRRPCYRVALATLPDAP